MGQGEQASGQQLVMWVCSESGVSQSKRPLGILCTGFHRCGDCLACDPLGHRWLLADHMGESLVLIG